MTITSVAAEALASIILRSTQGDEKMRSQLPWTVEDRGDCWLIIGTPASEPQRRLKHCQFSIFIRKTTAEVVGLRSAARYELDDAQHADLKARLPEEAFNAMYGPPVVAFEPDAGDLDFCIALYGGLINTSSDAIDYAFTLAQDDSATASFEKASYQASELAGIWRIVCQDRHDRQSIDLCSFSRRTGQVISGLLLHQGP